MPVACASDRERPGIGMDPAGRVLRRIDAHINDPRFGTAMADRLHQMITEGA